MSTQDVQLETPASIETLSAEIHALRICNAELQMQNQQLQHDVILLQRKLYGVRTERQGTEEQQSLFADIATTDAMLQTALTMAQPKTADAASQKLDGNRGRTSLTPTGRRDLSQSKLPRVTVEIPDRGLEAQGLKRVGVDTTYEIIGHKACYSVLVKNTVRYADTRPTSAATTVSAAQPPRMCPKSLFHESVLAKVLAEKFGLGTTLYRLEKHMATQDVAMDRGTMSRHIEHIGNTLGATVVEAMFRHAKATAHVMSTDATGAWILPEPSQVKAPQKRASKRCSKGHFFTVVVDADAVLFFYERDHTQVAVQRLFEGYAGYLQADASSVYHLLEHGPPADDDSEAIILVGCWAHCRRYFFEAAQCRYPQGVDGLLRIAAIFAADKPLWKLSAAERHAARAKDVAPLVDNFFAWVHAQRQALPMATRNLASRALGYAANQEAELRRVLDDPHLPLDNTRAERALRTPVISRKNSLFHGSDTHAEAAAAIFSVLQTCRLHGIDPQSYFEDVLRLLPQWPSDRYLELAPNFWRATRARIPPDQLASPLCWFSIPDPIAAPSV